LFHDLKVASVFLTRLPVRLEGVFGLKDLAAAVWAFPLVGVAIGLVGGLGFMAATGLGLPSLPAAIVAIAAMAFVTGALHEDGLADTCDGLGAGRDRLRALEIMRDSRVGSYGVIALVLSLLARIGALASLWDPFQVLAVLVAAGAASRATMPVVMHLQPSARDHGLAASAGRPGRERVALGCALALAIVLAALPLGTALRAVLALAVAAAVTALWLGRRLGGCTGDTLGAVQQMGEIAFLMAVVARW
jgi:adenosylcobinamide-GDP ribazoletransferase